MVREQYIRARYNHKGKISTEPTRLSETLMQLFERKIAPQQRRGDEMSATWEQLVPEYLREHCWLSGFSNGLLVVVAETPSYLYELELCSTELLAQLQRCCPSVGLRRIKLSLR